MKKRLAVISVGGSVIVPSKVDYNFLNKLKVSIAKLKKKYKIVICTGGGSTAREYIAILRKEKCSDYTQNLVGIETTRLNAKLLSSFLQFSNKDIPETLEEVGDMLQTYDVVVCGGLAPGQTSDGTTAQIAEYLGADMLVNMTNVPGLYTKDPRKYEDAKFIPRLSHEKFSKMLSRVKEKPGQHFVLDSVAEKITQKAKIKVVILKGARNLELCLEGKKFKGTVIS